MEEREKRPGMAGSTAGAHPLRHHSRVRRVGLIPAGSGFDYPCSGRFDTGNRPVVLAAIYQYATRMRYIQSLRSFASSFSRFL